MKPVTITVPADKVANLLAALQSAEEMTSFLYRNPRPEDEAAFDDTDRELVAEYQALVWLIEQIERTDAPKAGA